MMEQRPVAGAMLSALIDQRFLNNVLLKVDAAVVAIVYFGAAASKHTYVKIPYSEEAKEMTATVNATRDRSITVTKSLVQ